VLNQRTDNIRMVYENPSNANNIWASLRTLDTFGNNTYYYYSYHYHC